MGKVYMFNEKNLKQCIIYMRVRKSGRALELAVGCSESTPPPYTETAPNTPQGGHTYMVANCSSVCQVLQIRSATGGEGRYTVRNNTNKMKICKPNKRLTTHKRKKRSALDGPGMPLRDPNATGLFPHRSSASRRSAWSSTARCPGGCGCHRSSRN